jgi:hypothetical protein
MTLAELMNGYSRIYGAVVTPRDVAKRHLRMRLFDGPVSSEQVLKTAAIKGINRSTLHRAKKDLGVTVTKNGPLNNRGERTWQWYLGNIRLLTNHIAKPRQPLPKAANRPRWK